MPLDAQIPLMAQGIELNSPLNMLARATGVQNMLQQNQLQGMQMQDMHAQRAMQLEQARARQQFLANLPDPPADAPEHVRMAWPLAKAGLIPMEKLFEAMKPQAPIAGDKPLLNPKTMQPVYTPPEKPEKPEKEPSAVQEYKFAQGQGYRGSFDEWLRTKAQAIHVTAPQQAPSPSLTTIVDPADPTKMITVDARSWNPANRAGLVGTSGKEPTAAKREDQASTGREQVSGIVTNLRDMYTQLQTGGGIVDSKAGSLSNIPARLSSTGAGQFAGQLVGTKNQKLRDTIEQQRPLLLNAIKQATGMSAKQMDSNAELKLYLSAATDPTKDVAANLEALDNLERLFGQGAQGGARASAPAGSIDIRSQADAILRGGK